MKRSLQLNHQYGVVYTTPTQNLRISVIVSLDHSANLIEVQYHGQVAVLMVICADLHACAMAF